MIGVLLLNLGGPDSLNSVRPFLLNLFSDRDIIKLPVPPFLQKGMAWLIAKFRSRRVIGFYGVIGGRSPINEITKRQAETLEKFLNSKLLILNSKPKYRVYFGMRYSPPFIRDTLKEVIEDGIKSLIVLPLFPHYSIATTGSAFKELKKSLKESGVKNSGFGKSVSNLKIIYIESWYDHPGYLDALAERIKEGLQKFDDPENVQIVFSAHSLPKAFIDAGDPYLRHLEATIQGIIERVGDISWHLSFQSKSGPVKWLEPRTDYVINKIATAGYKKILMVPISFVSDHLETLYEIDMLYSKMAEDKGIKLKRTESLNTSPRFIEALGEIVLRNQ